MDIGWYFILIFGLGIAGAIGQEVYLHRKHGDKPREEKKPPRKSLLQQAKNLGVVLFLIMIMIIVLCVTCEQS